MVQIVANSAVGTRKPTGIAPVKTPTTSQQSALEMLLKRIANSTRLTLAEKQNFADAIKAAFAAGDYKMVAKIMMLISQLEMQRKESMSREHTVEEITGKASGGEGASPKLDTARLISGQARIRQLLLVP